MNLKPCPCGNTPSTLLIADNGVKWAYAFGDCCNEWHIEFRTAYNPIESKECMALAVTAWNLADRNAAEHSVQADKCRTGLAHVFKWDGTLKTPEMLECENCGIRR